MKDVKQTSVSENGNSSPEFIDFETDRYGSLKLIDWFDLDRVKQAKVLVIGAGAIGNEVLKNLALLGVGNIYIYDRDTIEMSNLTRSVLFRAEDCNRLKAQAAAEAVKKINPDINVVWRAGDIRFDMGLGLVRQMDVVIGCLDNRGARKQMNTECFRIGKPWIDAGIGQLNGQIRVYSPAEEDGACYECSFTPDDYVQVGMPCNRLASLYAAEGKIPTTPTIASIVAGIQVQEALKLLDYDRWRGRTLVSHEMIFNGTIGHVERVELVRRDTCTVHETISEDEIIELPRAAAKKTTFDGLLKMVEKHLGKNATLLLNFDIALSADCDNCKTKTSILKPVGLVYQEHLPCEDCGAERELDKFHLVNRRQTGVFERIKNLKLSDLNIPALHILGAVGSDGTIRYFELTGDRKDYF